MKLKQIFAEASVTYRGIHDRLLLDWGKTWMTACGQVKDIQRMTVCTD
jgi:hypothetical protein